MATVPATAEVVVIGAGIVGNSLVHHLAELGWRDIVQLDKGALPNPGGSTGHASNFIFPVDHSREITDLTLDSMRQYQEMGVFTESGGFEIARTEERMEELRRRMSSAKAWGIEAELVSPEFVKEKVPFIETDQFIGAFWTPSVGVVDSLRAGTIMRESALASGALTVVPTVEVVGLDVEDGRIRRVRTNGGDIEAEYVVIACGVWSPKIGDMAGISIPLTPAVHQMISVGPCPQLAEREGEISFPIIRDMDTFCYERQHGADMEVGSYAHRAILHEPEDIPSIEQAKLSPTEMPFTSDDFDPQLEQAYELMPELLGAEGAEMRYAINGLLSLTCDGNPILGESLVKGLWTASAVWIKEGPGVGRAVAEWMTHGHSEIDVHHSDIARFHPHQMRREHTRLRTTEAFIKTYGIIHPAEQYESDRDQRLAPMHESQKKLGAVFFETAGWERPQWYESNAGLLEEYGDAVLPREHEWDSRWWSPIINAEHLRMREAAGVIDLSAFQIFDITGPGALDTVQRTCVAQCDVAVGKVIYTPVLDPKGGFVSDLTVMRLGDDHFRVVTGGAHGRADLQWFTRQLPADGATTIADHTDEISTIGLWGPRARDILAALTPDDVSDAGFGFLSCREIQVKGTTVLASRISYVGELGWELYVAMDDAAELWETLLEAGAEHGAVPVGIGVYGTTGRIEKGYRAFGYELDAERSIVEAGMQRPKVKAADFVGREAYVAQRGAPVRSVLCTLVVDDHTSASGVKRYMLGGEPILTRDGGTLTDGHGHHPYVTTAGSAPSLGKHLLLTYLPPAEATIGNQLAVSYMEELYPVTVGSVDATALFDPDNARMR
ncbi:MULTISPECIES: GcvT family protein [unclassified Nocardioides]|uniref:GcvT family protein n=1 Tax=unclassified Nocardioides TaxID=2615069 RepID=UPI0009EFE731|nr:MULTISPECIES: FAD-dependent oxidoreductase [unclassified Nocardioides]GAW52386.1 glycine cleavage T protein (aminomethyl transferase) [Nocardioides sp. PD653-B2]GAW53872.1 glycine cleavage T protein (aminomethyl transferase) [Nocardioides sp. PD653]